MARRVSRSKGQVQAVLAIAVLSVMLMLGLLLFRPASPPTPAKLLQQALSQLEQAEEYALTIEENAPGYELVFQGKVEKETILTGTLPGYDLEVFHAGSGIYVRKAGEVEWEEALELQSLTGFLISPLELLQAQMVNFKYAAAGQETTLNGVPCKTVYLDVTQDLPLLKTLFPQINDAAIQSVSLGAAFREADLLLKQLRLLVEFHDTERLERAYYFE